MQQCPRCSQNVNPGARFCPHCAYDMTQAAQSSGYAPTQVIQSSACPNCGAAVAPNAKFCPVCATPIGAGFAGGVSSSGGQGYQSGAGYGGYSSQPGYPGAGYGAPARRSSNMPLIIGAIVLLVLIGGGVAAYFLWFNKPADSTDSNSAAKTNANSTGPVAADGPKVVTEKILRALERADRATVRSLSTKATSDRDVDELVNDASKDIQSHGGIDTITVTEKPPVGDKAEVQFELKYKDGQTQRGGWEMAKEDGQWRIKPR